MDARKKASHWHEWENFRECRAPDTTSVEIAGIMVGLAKSIGAG